MKKRTLVTILTLICVIGFWLFENFYTPDTYSGEVSKEEQKVFKSELTEGLLPSSTTNTIVSHNYYTLSYNEKYEQAEWVAYTLKKEHLTYDDRKRPFFIEDPKVKTKSADWRNYKRSGYDRGHLCPAGDRRFLKQAYDETFYTSNISPQDRKFNAGIWNRLEGQVRKWAKKYNEVFVITGGVLENGLVEIGDEDVAVPNRFFKIVAKGKGENITALGFLMQNTENKQSFTSFAVPIDYIEQETGIDFFKNLSDAEQEKLEKSVNTSDWKF